MDFRSSIKLNKPIEISLSRKVERLKPATLKKKIRTELVKANAIVEVARLAEN